MSDARDTYISQVAAGKSFADVGGLWGTVNEKVSVAHTHGARALTMIDVSPPDTELWVLSEMGRSASRRRWRSGVLKISVPGGGCRRLRRSEPCAKWPGFVMKPVPRVGMAMPIPCGCLFGCRTRSTPDGTPGWRRWASYAYSHALCV